MIHRLADCMNENVPENTNVWQFCVIFPDCEIGENCNICAGSLIENDVKVGNNVTIKSGIQLWDGVTIEDDVFLGPNVTFTNNLFPRSKQYPEKNARTLVKKGASIGANCTVLAGRTIGENAMVGAGSVVTKDIPANEVWAGNPAKFVRNINESSDNKIDKIVSGGGVILRFSVENLEVREELRSKGRVCGERRAA